MTNCISSVTNSVCGAVCVKLENFHDIINKSLFIKIIVDFLLIYGAPFVSKLNAFNGTFNML